MLDDDTGSRLVVSTNGTSEPQLMVGSGQVQRVLDVLTAHKIPHKIDHDSGMAAGKSFSVFNFGQGADVSHIQDVLNDAW